MTATFTFPHATLSHLSLEGNRANAGPAGPVGDPGPGQGGGVYVTAGSMACADAATVIAGNHASTSEDDVFGDLLGC